MPNIHYECDRCGKFVTLHRGSLSSIPFNRMPQLVLEADGHKCNKEKK